MTSSQSTHYATTRKVTLIGGIIDAILSVLKISIGLIGQSQALIADGVHSLSDLATDGLVIWAAKHAQAEPDDEHPYGHERIETLATMALSLTLIAVAIGFSYDAITRLIAGDQLQSPGWRVLIAALFSMLAKEWVYRFTMRAADQINSDLLRANAWHARSDAASSVIVLLGVLGVMLGFEHADAIASIGVSMMIGWIGWVLGRKGIEELIDTSVEPAVLNNILNTIQQVEGVTDVHQTRTRMMAGKIVMDTHITVNPKISVSEGHRIGDAVELAIRQNLDKASDITVHIDHEDDAIERPAYHLPLRGEVLADITNVLDKHQAELKKLSIDDFLDIKLHYIEGHIELEIWQEMRPELTQKPENLLDVTLKHALESIDYVSNVTLVYHRAPH